MTTFNPWMFVALNCEDILFIAMSFSVLVSDVYENCMNVFILVTMGTWNVVIFS